MEFGAVFKPSFLGLIGWEWTDSPFLFGVQLSWIFIDVNFLVEIHRDFRTEPTKSDQLCAEGSTATKVFGLLLEANLGAIAIFSWHDPF